MRKVVYATILTSTTINAIGGLGGPFKGLTFLDTINEAIRSEKLPVQFHTEDGNPAVTLQLVEKEEGNVLIQAHRANKYQQEGILHALKLKGFELMENGYVKPYELSEEVEEKIEEKETEEKIEEEKIEEKETEVENKAKETIEEEKTEEKETEIENKAEEKIAPKTEEKHQNKKSGKK